MAQTYRSRILSVHREADNEIRGLFEQLINATSRELIIRSSADGTIPMTALYHLQQVTAERVTNMFLGRLGGGRQPFTLVDGVPLPFSSYTRILFKATKAVQRLAVEQQASIMRRFLDKEPALQLRLRFASTLVAEQEQRLRPNPFATYDPVHLWVDPAGYQLSSRVWRTAGQTRRKIDRLIEETIRQGKETREIVRELEQFLTPGRQLTRRTPYGTTGSHDATRLLHTELSRAEAQAAETAALLNPFIEKIQNVLSPSHPVYDICDEAVAAGPFDVDAIPGIYQIPLHPECLCNYRFIYVEDKEAVRDKLREDARRGGLLNPLMVDRLLQLLITGLVAREAEEVFNG